MERGLLEQQFEHLTTQPSDKQEDELMSVDASESAETLLSMIRQNRGSTQTTSTTLSSVGLPRTVSQTPTDSLRENDDSQESATYSIPSTLGSFQLQTIAHPLPSSFPPQQGDQPTDPRQFKSALAAYSTASTIHSASDSASPRVSRVQVQTLQQSRNSILKQALDEADIEIVEEEPILQEQTTLFGVRRRLVEEYEELGRRSGRILSSKASMNMSQASESSSSPRSEAPLRTFDFVSEKEMRKKVEDLENREKELTIEALSKAEMAYVRIEIWTESRKGKWIIRGSAENDGE